MTENPVTDSARNSDALSRTWEGPASFLPVVSSLRASLCGEANREEFLAEIEPNRSSNRAWHLVATLPAGLFILLHLMAWVAPPVLWGADGLVYYGPLVAAAFIALPAAPLSLPRFLLPHQFARLW